MVIRVTVAVSPAPRQTVERELLLEDGSTAGQAVLASGLLERFPMLSGAPIGVWGKQAKAGRILRDQDRVEIYRPLKVDPKVARRERFVQQGSRSAGLFARKRPGAKAGY